jgi:hypothetical protein
MATLRPDKEKDPKSTEVIASGFDGRTMTLEQLRKEVSEELSGQSLLAVKVYDLHALATKFERENLVAIILTGDVATAIIELWQKTREENKCITGLDFHTKLGSTNVPYELTVVVIFTPVLSGEDILVRMAAD